MYQLKTAADFDSAHFLAGYQGKCSNIHGHRWHVEVEVQKENLQEEGQLREMITDFGDLKRDLRELTDALDHTLIYEAQSLRERTIQVLEEEGFYLKKVDFRPTAENFSRYFYDEMKKKGYPVSCATVYETPNNCASYREEK